MGNTLSKVFVVLLVVLLLFIYPLMQMFQHQDHTTRIFVYTETTKLVDAVRNVGHLTPQMYNEFAQKLVGTNNSYDIKLEHRHLKFDPIYEDPMDESTFGNNYAANYIGYYTKDILNTLFPEDGSGEKRYEFSQGDYFIVKVANKNKTLGTKVTQLIVGRDLPTQVIFAQYGGLVK